MKLLPCPFCGEKPDVETIGSHIEIWCCVSKSVQKSDYMSYEERMQNDFSTETHMYPDHIEKLVFEQVASEWNTRFINSHKGYLADLRNKYGQLYFYFQMMERALEKQDGECMEQFECEDLVKLNESFVELLKTDPDDWKDGR